MNLRRQKGRTPLSKFRARQPFGTGESRSTEKAVRDHLENIVIGRVRARCIERDGFCRLRIKPGRGVTHAPLGECRGPSEWAHLAPLRRFETRGRPPEERHTIIGSMMLCKRHHDLYEGRLRHYPNGMRFSLGSMPIGYTLQIDSTLAGADGPLRFTLGDAIYQEP